MPLQQEKNIRSLEISCFFLILIVGSILLIWQICWQCQQRNIQNSSRLISGIINNQSTHDRSPKFLASMTALLNQSRLTLRHLAFPPDFSASTQNADGFSRYLWWSFWDDQETLNNIPIIGTHHSATYVLNNVFSLYAKTQSMSILAQLNSGVRLLDIRLKCDKQGNLMFYHDIIPLGLSWLDVWNTLLSWLNTFPNEGLILLIRDESYQNHYNMVMKAISTTGDDKQRFILNNRQFSRIPTIGEMRGRVYVMNCNTRKILPWSDNCRFSIGRITIDDRYTLSTPSSFASLSALADKKSRIVLDYITRYSMAVSPGTINSNLYVVFTSLAASANPFKYVRVIAEKINNIIDAKARNLHHPLARIALVLDYYSPYTQ